MQSIKGQTIAALIREQRRRAGLAAAEGSAAATSALANELPSGHWAPPKPAAGREHPFPPSRLAENLQSIAFHPVSKHLVFVTDTGVAETWNFTTGKRVSYFGTGLSKEPDQVPSGPGGTIALSADGAWLASDHGRFVSIWDMASGQLLVQLPEEESSIMSLAWSPHEAVLAVGTFDGQLAIWNLAKIKAQLDEIGLGW